MATNSARFKALEKRVDELRARFLPTAFSQNGTYSAAQLDNARAFRVLAHAELEHFLEVRSLAIANKAFDLLKQKSKPSRSMMHLLSNIVGTHNGLPSELGTKTSVLSIAGKVLAQYRHAIMTNNGIRTQNLLRLLLPIGLSESDLDVAWLSTTDGFGTKRGTAAHSSFITYAIDPQDDFSTVQQIMNGLRDLDLMLNSIERQLR